MNEVVVGAKGISKEELPRLEHSKCKCPEAGKALGGLRKSRETILVKTE